MEELQKAILNIQKELKVPKGQFNKFGNFNYRSAEDILEAVKPLLAKYGVLQTISDEIVVIGERIYVQATVSLRMGDAELHTKAYAREDETKKGMDGSQVTGASSSYARKYALNGMYAIDDSKDADSNEYNSVQQEPKHSAPKITPKPANPNIPQDKKTQLKRLAAIAGYDDEWITSVMQKVKTSSDIDAVIAKLEAK